VKKWLNRSTYHWRNLANTIELLVCCSDAALSNYFHHLLSIILASITVKILASRRDEAKILASRWRLGQGQGNVMRPRPKFWGQMKQHVMP